MHCIFWPGSNCSRKTLIMSWQLSLLAATRTRRKHSYHMDSHGIMCDTRNGNLMEKCMGLTVCTISNGRLPSHSMEQWLEQLYAFGGSCRQSWGDSTCLDSRITDLHGKSGVSGLRSHSRAPALNWADMESVTSPPAVSSPSGTGHTNNRRVWW